MTKIAIKKRGWLTYAVFLTLMVSLLYYTNNFRFGGGVDSFIPALIMWPVATLLAVFLYFNYYVSRDRLIDFSAVLSILFLLATLTTFEEDVVALAADAVNNIAWWALLILFFHYAKKNGIDKKYIVTATATLPVLSVIFLQLVNSTMTESGIKTLNPIYYCLYLIPFMLLNEKTWQYIGMGTIFGAILISNKRTALIAFVLVLLFYVYRKQRESSRTILNTVRNLLLVIFLLIGIYLLKNAVLASYSVVDWRERLLTLASTGGGGRLGLWKKFFEDVKTSNLVELIFGHGFVYPEYHNDLFQVYYNCGIPGLVAYVGFCILLIREYLKMAAKQYQYTIAFGASLIIFFFNSMVGQVLVIHSWVLEMGAFWGLVLGDFRRTQRDELLKGVKKDDQVVSVSV